MGYICTYTDKSWVFLETWSSMDTLIEGAWVICVHISADTLTEGAWVICVHISADTLTEGAWDICVHLQMNHGLDHPWMTQD